MAGEPIYKAIQELRKELEHIDYVIQAVEESLGGQAPPRPSAQISGRSDGPGQESTS